MADLKISAMTQPGTIFNADILPLVQGGVNIAATRTDFLKPVSGELVAFSDATNYIGLLHGFGINLHLKAGFQALWTYQADTLLSVDVSGNFFLQAVPGGLLTLQGNGAAFGIDSTGGIVLIPAGGQIVTIGYTPGNAGDWAGSPVDYQGALDRIAAKLASLFGPIP